MRFIFPANFTNPAIKLPGRLHPGLRLDARDGRHWKHAAACRLPAERLVQRHLPKHHWDLLK